VAGPTATVSEATLHMYVLNGLIRAVTLRVLAVVEMLVIGTLLFSATVTMYLRIMPFRCCGRGRFQERTSDLEVSALTWKLVGGPDGTAEDIKGNQ